MCISYTLKDGKTLLRSYSLAAPKDCTDMRNPLLQFASVYNSLPFVLARNTPAFEVTRANVGDMGQASGFKVLHVQGKGREEADAFVKLSPAVQAALIEYLALRNDRSLSAPLFIVRGGTAQQAVMETGDDKTDVTEALAALEKDITLDGTSHAYTCTDIARALAGSGCAVVGAVACVRTPESEGGKLALAPAGYAIFRDGDYVGSIEPETARGASMLLGVAGHGDLAVTDRDGSTVMLTLDTCKTDFRPVWGGDGTLARVDVTLKLRAGIAELRVPRRITAREYQDELNAALAALVTGWAEDVIAASQALGADFLGVGQALAIGGGRRWAAIRDDWPAVWQSVPVRVTVSADVGRTFDLRDGIDTSGGGT